MNPHRPAPLEHRAAAHRELIATGSPEGIRAALIQEPDVWLKKLLSRGLGEPSQGEERAEPNLYDSLTVLSDWRS